MFNDAKYLKWKAFFEGVLESLEPSMGASQEKREAWLNSLEDEIDNYEEDC